MLSRFSRVETREMSLTKVAFRSSHSVEMAALGEHHFLYNFHCCFVGWVDISFASLSLKETVKVVLSRVLAEPQIFHRFPSIGQTQREGEREGERERHLAALQPMNARDQNQEKATYGAPPTDRDRAASATRFVRLSIDPSHCIKIL